ncbi:hypothetical protein NMY22_g7318 [Coprinellus aureogranulatus]|nr:hypothetical protein NMY22_g7318 [Coprinellus aureogranulatus]
MNYFGTVIAVDVKVQVREPSSSRKKGRSKATGSSKPYDRPSGSRRATRQNHDAASSSNPSAHLRRSLRISAEELVRREAALLASEREFDQKSAELHKALSMLKQKETEAARMMSRLAEREAQDTLMQLEQSFLCPLCYEVFSAPHTLNAPNCGHTFCGLCILKWFCSRLHGCGAWHEQVYCPMCRAEVHTPDRRATFPFIPNRLATTTIAALTEKLCARPPSTAMLVKREESEEVFVSGSKAARGRSCSRASQQAKTEEDSPIPDTTDVDGWREGGILRTEWLKKDR